MDKTIKQWNSNGQCRNTLEGHNGVVRCLYAWRNLLYSGSYDRTVRVWRFNGGHVRTLKGHTHWVTCLTSWRLSCEWFI